jgi:hypothetical protein
MSDEFKVTEGNITFSFTPPPGAEGKRLADMCWELWQHWHMAGLCPKLDSRLLIRRALS